MFYLRTKKIFLIFAFMITSFFFFECHQFFHLKSVETVALPVSNKVVILDAGHGFPDERCPK